MSTRAVRVFVSGRVQGVFYRASTVEQATRAGLTGWVRNLPDGRVEAHLEGSQAAIDRVVIWCRQGPPLARVDDLQVEARDPEGHDDFAVRPRR